MNIPFNIPVVLGTEQKYISDVIDRRSLCGDNRYTKLCNSIIEEKYMANKALLTSSCTHALELAALLCDLKPGDEVIMPSFTFVSTANAFALRGATPVFVDIRPDTQNINEKLIEEAITPKTKVIVSVHYAGVACDMDKINDIANHYKLKVVEDAAQGVNAFYKGNALGTLGNFGCYSFHETKNYTMGEGGALLIRDEEDFLPAEIIREKGTNRVEFLLGFVDKYTWIRQGSSYLPSELNAAFLYAQLTEAEKINTRRLEMWNRYYNNLNDLEKSEKLSLPCVPDYCTHNAHMFYIKAKDKAWRNELIKYLRERGVTAPFHYVPLHLSEQGIKIGRFSGRDNFTTDTADRLLRLPLYYDLTLSQVDYICELIFDFYKGR